MSSLTAKEASKTDGAAAAETPRLPQVVIGRLADLSPDGTPLVDFPGNTEGVPLAALSAAAIGAGSIGREVALLFADGDPRRPFVVGLLQQPSEERETELIATESAEPVTARVDGEEVVITANKQIQLKCGRASITLTRAGKVLIRGAYLLNRSSGVNRIKGGSVQIN